MPTSGLQLGQRAEQLRGAADRRDDLEPVRFEQPDEAVPEQEEVFTDDDAHGTPITASTAGQMSVLVCHEDRTTSARPP